MKKNESQSSTWSETSSEDTTMKRLRCYVSGIGKIEDESQLFYPGTNIRRECARYSKLKRNKYYAPPEYSSSNLKSADPDDLNGTNIPFNRLENGIDRRSVKGGYKVVGGRPMNPAGRTGITGRGDLLRWGPNHISCIDLRREIGNETAVYLLQLRVVRTLSNGMTVLTIPCSYVDNPYSDMPEKALKSILEELALQNGRQRAKEILKYIFDRKKLTRKYYHPSRLNTDNAWVEKTIWKLLEYWNYDLSSLNMEHIPNVVWKIIKITPL
ncbi:hypothetical protein TTRE_0000520801 [Trichuris trichiura]|uniref:ADP-ribose pyrophosphatase, mitochondrial n=1 Tax=Trichuris trichiura TaxID=36087 RepID=A0A077ZE31_TRITR|nr:hypothetical protein TTRE_0000520801 [Trichuris trichiura]